MQEEPSMSDIIHKDIQRNKPVGVNTDIFKLADGINNALFAIAGNAELIRLKASDSDHIDDHIFSILELTEKIARYTIQLSTPAIPEKTRD